MMAYHHDGRYEIANSVVGDYIRPLTDHRVKELFSFR